MTIDDYLAIATREYLMYVLVLARGNVSEAARIAGRNRTAFHGLLTRHGLRGELSHQGSLDALQ